MCKAAVLVFVIATALVSVSDASQNSLDWQVGKPDGGYAEFGLAGRYQDYQKEFPGGATFEVGKGDSARNWIYVQPGPEARWAGEGEHPFEVVFDLDSIPKDPLLLTINLIDVSPGGPVTLRVRVNEKIRSFDLEPGASDASLTDPSKGHPQTIRMYVAGGFLHQGRNVVNLTVTRGAWVIYDSLSMTTCTDLPHLADEPVLDNTYLFRNHAGGLKQIVYGSIDLFRDQKSVRAELVSEEGWRVEQVFSDVPSGRRDLEIEIAPVETPQKAHLRLFVGSEVYEADGVIRPQRRWQIFILPSSHFDYGYTAVQDKVMKRHRENLDRAIDWCGRYRDVGWDLEASFIAQDYLAHGSHPERLIDLARQGRIGVMGLFTNTLTGLCSSEGLSRDIDYYDFLRRKYGIESKCAMENDIPSMVGTLPMILREHGIKYLAHGTNPVHAGTHQSPDATPYYWEAPDGSKVLVVKTVGSYAEAMKVIGLNDTDEVSHTLGRINSVINDYARRKDYRYDAILMHGAYMDNVANDEMLAQVPEKWNREYAYPKIVFGRGCEFFEHIEKNYGKSIPTIKGDGGVWWEDGAGSSARETGLNRIAEENLVTAEKLLSLCDPAFQRKVAPQLAEAWRNALLFDEHTWGASASVDAPGSKETLDQWAVKKSFADRASAMSKTLLDRATDRLCASLHPSRDSVAVFNPSSWVRTERVSVLDLNGGKRTLIADSVPPMGYKVFPLSTTRPEQSHLAPGDVLDNAFYTVKFDRTTGGITSIYDKQLGRELVDPSKYGLNTYLYVTGGDGPSWDTPRGEKLSIAGVNNASLEKSALPGRQVMRVTCDAPNTRSMTCEVVLYDNTKRIDFIDSMDKIETTRKEGCYFTFPFAFRNPSVRVEIPDGVIRAEIDQFPGACRDFYCVQSFLTMSDDSAAVVWTPVDSPLVTLQDIARGQWYDHLKIENGTMFAYVMNNYWFTNYKAGQGGPLTFRFAMTSGTSVTDIQAKRFGESVRSPLICKIVAGRPGGKPIRSCSYVEVAGEGVVLQALKPARFTDGTVLRVREMAGKNARVRVLPRIAFERAWLSNLAEDKLKPLRVDHGWVELPCRALGLATVILER